MGCSETRTHRTSISQRLGRTLGAGECGSAGRQTPARGFKSQHCARHCLGPFCGRTHTHRRAAAGAPVPPGAPICTGAGDMGNTQNAMVAPAGWLHGRPADLFTRKKKLLAFRRDHSIRVQILIRNEHRFTKWNSGRRRLLMWNFTHPGRS